MELFQLLGTIAINSNGANETIDGVSSKAKGLGDKLQTVGGKVTSFGNNLSKKLTLPAAAAGGAILAFANKSASAGDRIDKMSQKIGISRQAFQELDFICSQSGTSVDTLQMGLKTMTNQMQSAAGGGKTASAAFEKLGLSIYDNNGQLKDQETMMWETMSALQDMKNQTEKAALATDMFGRSGSELMPLLNGASGSIEEMKQKAHKLGLVISDEAVDSSVVFSDTIDQLKRSMGAAATKVGTALLPIITKLAQAFITKGVPAIQKFSEKVQAAIKWFEGLDSGTKKVIATIAALVVGIGPVLSIGGKLITTVGNIINTGKLLITVIGGLSAPMLAAVAGITALIAIGVKLYKNWDTIKAKAAELKTKIITTFNSIPAKMKSIGTNIVQGLWNGISNAKDWVISKIRGFGDSILSSLKSFFGIHSPSTVMEKQIGKNLALGVANGITKNKKYAKKSAAELGQIIVDAAQKKLDKYKTYNNMTLTAEVEFWNQIRKQCKKGTAARLEADKEYYAAKKDLNEQLKALEDDYQAKIDEASKKITDRTKEILNAFSLFDEFKIAIDEENPLTSDTLLNNLSSQVNALDDWTKEMATLKGKIGDTDLYAAVQKMGVNSLQQVKAINSMTEEQLNKYVELYDKRAELAKEQATTELGAEVMQEMTDAYKEYEDAVTKLGATVEKKYQGINNVIKTTMTDTDKITSEKMTTMISTFKNGTKSMADTVVTKFGSIGSKITSTMSSAAASLKSSVNSMIADLARLAAAQAAQQTTTTTTKTTSAKGSSSSTKTTVKKNAEGGILTKPTIFGYTPSTGQWQLGGEAGAEAIAPIETLKQYVAEAVASQNGELISVLLAILKAIKEQNLSVTLDGKEIANNVNKRLGVIY